MGNLIRTTDSLIHFVNLNCFLTYKFVDGTLNEYTFERVLYGPEKVSGLKEYADFFKNPSSPPNLKEIREQNKGLRMMEHELERIHISFHRGTTTMQVIYSVMFGVYFFKKVQRV
jgi:hypothetical protein